MEEYHGMRTKQTWRDEINESISHKTEHKLSEFFDDYTYAEQIDTAKRNVKMGIFVCDKELLDTTTPVVALFMEYGPPSTALMIKLLEWRMSGDSLEIGHKGGGNLRNIYGHKSSCTSLFSRLDDTDCLFAETYPNKIYDYSKTNIDESTFSSAVNSSEFVNKPQHKKLSRLPAWYNVLYDKIKSGSGVSPGFIVCMELTDVSSYDKIDSWNYIINILSANQYKIPIYVKNELVGDKDFLKLNNIDLVGFNKCSGKRVIELHFNTVTKEFYIMHDNKLVEVTKKKLIPKTDDIVLWGHISMFIADSTYFKEQLKLFNKNLTADKRISTHAEFYGAYIQLNDKLTSCKPIKMPTDPQGKANKISEGKDCNLFRLIIKPGSDICHDPGTFNALVNTKTIKPLTDFSDKSPSKAIIQISMDIYKNKEILKSKKVKNPSPKPIHKKEVMGGCYLVLLGGGLWKYGHVTMWDKLGDRIKQHKSESIDRIKTFIKTDVTEKYAIEYWSNSSIEYKGLEEKIGHMISNNRILHGEMKIEVFLQDRTDNEDREYFRCDDINYMMYTIIPKIKLIV